MPTKRTRISRKMNGDFESRLKTLLEDPSLKYFYADDDELAKLVYSPLPISPTPEEMAELRQLWLDHGNEIRAARDLWAPELQLWGEREFDGEEIDEVE